MADVGRTLDAVVVIPKDDQLLSLLKSCEEKGIKGFLGVLLNPLADLGTTGNKTNKQINKQVK